MPIDRAGEHALAGVVRGDPPLLDEAPALVRIDVIALMGVAEQCGRPRVAGKRQSWSATTSVPDGRNAQRTPSR